MPDAPVVVNNTPLVALWTVSRVDLLRDLFEEVLIPPAVQAEFLAVDSDVRQRSLEECPWIKVVPLQNPRRVLAYAGLDRGEAEVLALAEEKEAGLVVMDERKGRRYAQRLGLPLTGTLGLLLLAKEEGLLDSVAALIDQLRVSGLYLSPVLIARTLELAGESKPA